MITVNLFFFNDTATTEIYTYGHTLSLHDALPIFGFAPSKIRKSHSSRSGKVQCTGLPNRSSCARFFAPVSTWSEESGAGRSEEHTSELQSLMRISYAVFCLKQKQYNKQHNHT